MLQKITIAYRWFGVLMNLPGEKQVARECPATSA